MCFSVFLGFCGQMSLSCPNVGLLLIGDFKFLAVYVGISFTISSNLGDLQSNIRLLISARARLSDLSMCEYSLLTFLVLQLVTYKRNCSC